MYYVYVYNLSFIIYYIIFYYIIFDYIELYMLLYMLLYHILLYHIIYTCIYICTSIRYIRVYTLDMSIGVTASAAVRKRCGAAMLPCKNLLGLSQLPNLSRVLHKPQNDRTRRTSGVFQLRKSCGQEKHDKQGNASLTIRTPLFVCLIFNVCIMCAGTYTCVLGLALT